MLIQIGGLHLNVSPIVLGGVAAGVAVVLIILIICCCWCCCQRKNKKEKQNAQKFHGENPPAVQGNQNGRAGQHWQQQNTPPRMPELRMVPNYSPPTRFPAHLPAQSSASSTSSSSLPPHSVRWPPRPSPESPYIGQNTKKNGSSVPPQSPGSSFGSSQTMFAYEELVIATNGFSKGNILGEGGFGFVHKGVLPTGKDVAVKSLKSDSGQGEREFKAEVEIISRVHHRHLVSLVGYCNTGSLRLLVYEFVPNKTLEFHLHGQGQPEMEWPSRMKVAIGAAKGLAYLHEDCHPRIIHRDIKAANILLDDKFEAKVADFGLAKFYSILDTHVSTRVMGSLGYLAPEYASSGQLSAKSDVYSFGVILLELITGRKAFDRTRDVIDLVEWGRPLLTNAIQDENFNYLVDPLIQYCFKHTEMARMVYCAAACVRKSARRRPRMSQVVRALEGNMPLSDLKEGVMSDISSVNRGGISEYSGSEYQGDSTENRSTGVSTRERYFSGEDDAMTSEYGLNASSSSGEGGTTRELDTEEVKREIRRAQRPFDSAFTQN